MSNPILSYWYTLYNRPTSSEVALEPVVASCGVPYRFQHLVGNKYILDFVFIEHKIGIEVDGAEHYTLTGRKKDAARDEWLSKRGWKILRMSNFDAKNNGLAKLNELLENAGVDFRARSLK